VGVHKTEGFSKSAKKMTLNSETSEGIRIAGVCACVRACVRGSSYNSCQNNAIAILSIFIATSFCEMAQYLLKLPGVKSILSNRLCCQDSLEQFFGKQRQQGGTNDNPNIQQFENNTSTLRIANSFTLASFHGNCSRSQQAKKHECPSNISVGKLTDLPLPKRIRKGMQA